MYFVNSKFTNLFCNNKFRVLYPPVFFKRTANNVIKNEKLIVSIQRYHPSKHLEVLIDLAKLFRQHELDYKIINIGSLTSIKYYSKLLKLKQKLSLDNLRFYTNLSRETIIKLLNQAKFYIHTTKYEPFGIFVVEAIYNKCIPIVHKYSGS